MHLKIINASHGHIHQHENTNTKLYSFTANIYFKQ